MRGSLPNPKTIHIRLIILVAVFSLFHQNAFAQTSQTFTSNGKFTVPFGVTSVTVECWGGGGRGGSAIENGKSHAGGGGGGGAYAKKVVSVIPGNAYDVVVGTGGNSDGNLNGGDSYFIDNTTVLAKGGTGVATNILTGGSGGSSATSVGSIVYGGGSGATGVVSNYGGGGGSSAGTGSNGTNGNNSNGGTAPTGGGNGGDGSTNNGTSGSPGVVPGGGGGGATKGTGNLAPTGGSGANGQIIITYTVSILNVTPTSLDFGYIASGNTSSNQTYTLSGSNLTGYPGNITVAAPANFQVSLSSSSGFGSSVSVPYSTATLANTTIYVRFLPTSTNTSYGGNITNSGGGATTQNLAVTGNSNLNYCTSVPISGGRRYVSNVSFNTINNATTQGTYTDYTSTISTNVYTSLQYTLTVTLTFTQNATGYIFAWFDWNQNGVFTDSGEYYYLGSRTTNGSLSVNITVPSGAVLGNTRMRVTASSANNTGPCDTGFYGEVEDYGLNILSAATITTGIISPTSYCPGSSVNVPFNIAGTFSTSNVFTAQLSDATGSFNSPTNIGTLTATTSGTITAAIPAAQAGGSGYRIRVVSSSPPVTGSDNGTNLTVSPPPSAAATITGVSSVTLGQTGVSYSVPAIANATSYVWSYSGTGATINGTGSSVTIDFSGSATSGSLTVYGTNSCGNGAVSPAFPITITSSFNSFWYKADQGTSTTTDNSGIISWADQSGQSNDASSRNTPPAYQVSGWNFNPKVNFSSGYFLTAGNKIADDMTFFAVYNSIQNTGSSSFWLTPAIIGGETSAVTNDYTLSTNSGKLYFKGTSGDNFGAQTTATYNDGKVRIVSVTRQKSASGAIYLYVNGEQAATAASDNTSLTGPTQLGIGNHYGYQASAQFVGDISEVFGVNNVYSALQRQGFESYLAIKYGISLSGNYYSSGGTAVWTTAGGYQNDVHGIGRDDVYGLDQRSSRSENPGTDILTIQSGSTFSSPSNAQTGTALLDGQFLLTGHNNGSTTALSEWSTGINVIARKWYAQVTNSLPTESFQFDLTGTSLGTYCKIGLLIADDENLSTNQRFVEGTLNSSTLTVNDAAITGNKYFTVATLVLPTAGTIASDQTICNGDTPATFTSAIDGTGFGSISYRWERSVDGSNWSAINGATNSTYSPVALTQTTFYRRKTVATLGSVSCISSETNSIVITVNPNLSAVTLTPATMQTICSTGAGTQLAATETGGSTITSRQWGKRSVSGGTITNISGATGDIYTPNASNLGTGTWYVVCTSTPACGSAIVSNEVTVKVYSPFTAGSISTTGESICSGGDPGVIGSSVDASGGDGSITYKWQANGVDIASSNSATYNPPAGLTTNTTYTRWAKDNTCNTTFTQSAGSWMVMVTPSTSISSQSTSGQSACLNDSFTSISISAEGTGSLTYQWYSNTTPSTTGGTNLGNTNGAQTSTYTPQASSPGTLYYYCIVTGACGSATSAASGAFVVNSPVSITTQPISLSNICLGSDQSFSVFATGTNPLSYQWKKNGVDISGANLSTLNLNNIQASDAGNYSVVVSNSCGNVTSNTVTLTVDNTPPVLNDLSSKSQNLGCVNKPLSGGYVINGLGLANTDFSDNCNSDTELIRQYKIVHNSETLVDFGDDPDGDASGFAFPEGISTIIYRIKDQNNNTSSEKSFTVEFWYLPGVSGIKMN